MKVGEGVQSIQGSSNHCQSPIMHLSLIMSCMPSRTMVGSEGEDFLCFAAKFGPGDGAFA